MAGAGMPFCVVVPSFWSDPDVRTLTPEGRYLLLYFITSPHSNMIGLYYVPLRYVAAETGLMLDQVGDLMDGLQPFLAYDENTQEVLIHNYARYQIGDTLKASDNRTKTVNRLLRQIHSPQLVAKFASLYRDWPIDVSVPSATATEQGENPLPPDPAVPAAEVGERKRRAPKEHMVDGFDLIKAAYPKRDGDNGWTKAEGHFGIWLKKGESFDDLMTATKRYAAYVRRSGREGTDKVKQAATFFGPNGPWKEYLPPPQLRVVTPVAGVISAEQRILRSKLDAGLITQEEFDQAMGENA